LANTQRESCGYCCSTQRSGIELLLRATCTTTLWYAARFVGVDTLTRFGLR